MKKKKKNCEICNKHSFTLMELLAVIVIIALIVAIAVPVVMQIISRAGKEAFSISVKNILRQLEYQRADRSLALTGEGQNGDVSYTWVVPGNTICLSANNKKYEVVNMNCTDADIVDYGQGNKLKITDVTGNPTDWTNQNVILTVAADGGLPPYQYSFDNGATWQLGDQKEFFENTEADINVKDSLGIILSTAYKVKIDKIDKEAPKIDLSTDKVEINQNDPINLNDYATATDNIGIKRIIITGSLSNIIVGTYTISYQSEDLAGNLSEIKNLTVRVKDNIKPTLTLSNVSSNWYNDDVTLDVTMTDNDGGSGVQGYVYCLKTDASACLDTDYGDVYTNNQIIVSNEGYIKLSVKAKDIEGNYSNPVVRDIKIDKTSPTITVNGSTTPLTIDHSVGTQFVIPTAVVSDSLSGVKGSVTTTGTVSDIVGTYTIIYTAYDNANNVSTFILNVNVEDTSAPNITLSPSAPNGSGWYTNNINILVTATDNDEINTCSYRVSTDGGVSYPASWTSISGINNVTPKTITITQEGNNMKVMVRCTDFSSLFNEKGTTILKQDKTAPTCASSGGNAAWTNVSRTLTGTCSDTGSSGCSGNVTKTYSSNINSTTETPGTVTDVAGNSVGCPANQTVKVDKTAPTCVSSGGDANWTTVSRTLTGTCSDTGGSNCVGNVTKTYSTNISSTTESPGTVTDGAGNSVVCPANQTVKVDVTAPSIPSVNLNGYSSGAWTNQNVTTTLSASDNLSGVSSFQYSHDNASWAAWPSNPWTINWDGSWTFYTRTIDNAGNVSGSASPYAINRDTVPPTFTYFYIGGTGNPNSVTSTSTTLYASVSGATQMCVSNSTSCSAWEAYASTNAWTLTSGYGTKTVYAWFKDAAGNQIGYYTDSVDYLQPTHTTTYTCTASGYSYAETSSWVVNTSTVIQGSPSSGNSNYYGIMFFDLATIKAKWADYDASQIVFTIYNESTSCCTTKATNLYIGGPCPTLSGSGTSYTISGAKPTALDVVTIAAPGTHAAAVFTVTKASDQAWINSLMGSSSKCLYINKGDAAYYWEGMGSKDTTPPKMVITWVPR